MSVPDTEYQAALDHIGEQKADIERCMGMNERLLDETIEQAAEIDRLVGERTVVLASYAQRGLRIEELGEECLRLEGELAKVKTDYRTYVDGVDHAMNEEVTRLTLAVLFFAKHYDGPPDNMLSADERHLFAAPERIRAKETQ